MRALSRGAGYVVGYVVADVAGYALGLAVAGVIVARRVLRSL